MRSAEHGTRHTPLAAPRSASRLVGHVVGVAVEGEGPVLGEDHRGLGEGEDRRAVRTEAPVRSAGSPAGSSRAPPRRRRPSAPPWPRALPLGVRIRTPSAWKARSAPREPVRVRPGTGPRNEAMRPRLRASARSSALRARQQAVGVVGHDQGLATSSCSRAAVTGWSARAAPGGTSRDQNWAPTPPSRSRGMSVSTSRRPRFESWYGLCAQRPDRPLHAVGDGVGREAGRRRGRARSAGRTAPPRGRGELVELAHDGAGFILQVGHGIRSGRRRSRQ